MTVLDPKNRYTDVNGEFIDIKYVQFWGGMKKKEGKMISISVNTVVWGRSEAFRELYVFAIAFGE